MTETADAEIELHNITIGIAIFIFILSFIGILIFIVTAPYLFYRSYLEVYPKSKINLHTANDLKYANGLNHCLLELKIFTFYNAEDWGDRSMEVILKQFIRILVRLIVKEKLLSIRKTSLIYL